MNDFVVEAGIGNIIYTNDLHQYDPETNTMTRLTTTGAFLTPRSDFGVARLDHRVFVLGGCSKNYLRDFLMLDLESLQWTYLDDPSHDISIRPKLVLISTSHILHTDNFAPLHTDDFAPLHEVHIRRSVMPLYP